MIVGVGGGRQFIVVSGTPAQVDAVKNAVSAADVAQENTADGQVKATIRPVGASSEGLRESILTLQGSGSARLEAGTLVLEGQPRWIRRSLKLAVRAELEAAGEHAVVPGPGVSQVTVPAGVELVIDGEKDFLYPRARVIVAEGRVTLKAGNGMRLETARVRISFNTLATGGEKRVVIEPLDAE